jgi:branched-chain amino acid transport system substrate-binding protein
VPGLKDDLGDKVDSTVVTTTYEAAEPAADSQLTSLQPAGVNVSVVAAIPKMSAQAIRKVYDLVWRPVFFLTNMSMPVGAAMKRPALRMACVRS